MPSLHFNGRRIPCALAALLLLAAAGKPQPEPSQHFTAKQCNEDAIRVRVDPNAFREVVGTTVSLVLEEGKANLLLLAQDCSQYWIDGENVGPTQDFHVWLSIDGAKDTRPVVGAQLTRPTMTWLRLFHGSTNARARNARTAADSIQTPIDGVFLDPPAAKRGGRVSLSKSLTYSWRLVSATPPVRLVGVNHDVRTRTRSGEMVLDQVQALLDVFAAGSQGTLDVTGSTELLPWIRAGNYPVSANTFFPMWARATLNVPTRGR